LVIILPVKWDWQLQKNYMPWADVTLIMGPSSIFACKWIKICRVNTAEEMYNACTKEFDRSDIGVMASCVADYTL
jgi:phosphopantothenoylcysteine decarboxylase/phosphopantothenate--cysteine ligase